MASIKLIAGCCVAVTLGACTNTKQFAATGFKPPERGYKLIVMRPDVNVGSLTAGGEVEPREDWTNEARSNILRALETQQLSKGGVAKIATTRQDAGVQPALADELDRLHQAVGTTIQIHKYGELKLPTKKDKFDWTLGEAAVSFGKESGYDYALFLHVEDTFATAGRVALQAVEFMGCMVGVCVMSNGGQQVAFASLVNLKTGDVVWFNALSASTGDVRTPDGATKLVTNLLNKMEPSKS